MKRAFTPGLTRASEILIRRRRELPVKGEILKRVGDSVCPTETVARAELPGDLFILRLPEKMGLNPEEVLEGLRVKQGQEICSGEVICERSGFFGLLKSNFVSPQSGRIEFISERTAHLGLRSPSRKVEVNAYLQGQVLEVEAGKSLLIEARAAMVQGIFGVGGENTGTLKALDLSSNEQVQERHVPDVCDGQILFGGAGVSVEALRKASTTGARGFVCGAIDDRALSGFLGYDIGIALTGDEDISMTLVFTEGFGQMPMSRQALDLLLAHEGRQAVLNGATQVRAGALRPEIIICQDYRAAAVSAAASEEDYLRCGSNIRIIRHPWFGQEAQVQSIPQAPQRIETGAVTRVVEVKLLSGETITVPRANIELAAR